MRPLIREINFLSEITDEMIEEAINMPEAPFKYTVKIFPPYYNKMIGMLFKTNKGTEYKIEFIEDTIDSNTKSKSNISLSEILNILPINNTFTVVDIGFTLSDRLIEKHKVSYEKYMELTNEYDQYNVFNDIISVLKQYINLKPETNIFIIDTHIRKAILNISKYIYSQTFSNNFQLFETNNNYLFIKKSILK